MFVISKINSIFLSLQYECVNLQNHVMITLVDIEKTIRQIYVKDSRTNFA